MGHSTEIVGAITEFRPEVQKSPFVRTDLGIVTTEMGDKLRVVHGPFNYRRRLVGDPRQPLLYGWTTQPVIALLDERGGAYPLPYEAEVNKLPEALVQQVADILAAVTR